MHYCLYSTKDSIGLSADNSSMHFPNYLTLFSLHRWIIIVLESSHTRSHRSLYQPVGYRKFSVGYNVSTVSNSRLLFTCGPPSSLAVFFKSYFYSVIKNKHFPSSGRSTVATRDADQWKRSLALYFAMFSRNGFRSLRNDFSAKVCTPSLFHLSL